MAPTATGKSAPPVPHVAVSADVAEPEKPVTSLPKRRRGFPKRMAILGGVALLLIAGGGFFAFKAFVDTPPPPPPKAKSATPTPTPTPKATQAPKQAVDKAKEVVKTGGDRTAATNNVLGPDTPATKAPSSTSTQPAPRPAPTMTTVAPGVSASVPVQAAPEASPAFRSFVANARVSGVFQGTPPRAFINGRLAQRGDTIDSSLGIVFEGVDAEKRLLIFKDKSGATASKKY